MVSMTLSDPTTLTAVVRSMQTLVDEATIHANSDGLTFTGMDPSHIALLHFTWNQQSFKTYTYDSAMEDFAFGIRINDVIKILPRLDKDKTTHLEISGDFLNISQNTKTFKSRLFSPEQGSPKIPKTGFSCSFHMPPKDFLENLKDIAVMSEYITIETMDGFLQLSGRGDAGDAIIKYDSFDAASGTGVGVYNLPYIIDICKATLPISSDDILVKYDTDKPLYLSVSGGVDIAYYLAPRTEQA